MRYVLTTIAFILFAGTLFFSCKKWKDPAPTNPDGLNGRYYCNIPTAVNYNWGFPGIEDNSLCFYPSDVFAGSYSVHDSVYQDTLFLRADSFIMTINRISDTTMSVIGFCANGNSIRMSAGLSYVATVDSLVGDSTSFRGQLMCRSVDTVAGIVSKDKFDSTLVRITFTVASDTGIATHYGSARKR